MIGNAIGLYQCHTNMGNAFSYNIMRAIDITVGWEFSTILISSGTITIYTVLHWWKHQDELHELYKNTRTLKQEWKKKLEVIEKWEANKIFAPTRNSQQLLTLIHWVAIDDFLNKEETNQWLVSNMEGMLFLSKGPIKFKTQCSHSTNNFYHPRTN